jgi:hypothetical protein
MFRVCILFSQNCQHSWFVSSLNVKQEQVSLHASNLVPSVHVTESSQFDSKSILFSGERFKLWFGKMCIIFPCRLFTWIIVIYLEGFGIYIFSLSLCSLMTVDGIMIYLQRCNSHEAFMHWWSHVNNDDIIYRFSNFYLV